MKKILLIVFVLGLSLVSCNEVNKKVFGNGGADTPEQVAEQFSKDYFGGNAEEAVKDCYSTTLTKEEIVIKMKNSPGYGLLLKHPNAKVSVCNAERSNLPEGTARVRVKVIENGVVLEDEGIGVVKEGEKWKIKIH